MRRCGNQRGFSLIEMMIVVLVLGISVAIGVPAYTSISRSYQVKGAAENIGGQVKLMRSKAMATGRSLTMHFVLDSTSAGDYHVHDNGRIVKWDLPRGVTYASGSSTGFTIMRDGRISTSSYVIVRDERGNRDTVSVQLSGLVLMP